MKKTVQKRIGIKAVVLKKAVCFGFLLLTASLAPLLGHQFFTGTTVNAALFISTAVLGLQGAFLIAVIPSLIAFSTGLLPGVLLPMIPFIIVGNTILAASFNKLKGNYWMKVGVSSFLKFIFLFFSSSIILSFKEVPQPILAIMGLPQLITAISGGILAYLILMPWNLQKDTN